MTLPPDAPPPELPLNEVHGELEVTGFVVEATGLDTDADAMAIGLQTSSGLRVRLWLKRSMAERMAEIIKQSLAKLFSERTKHGAAPVTVANTGEIIHSDEVQMGFSKDADKVFLRFSSPNGLPVLVFVSEASLKMIAESWSAVKQQMELHRTASRH